MARYLDPTNDVAFKKLFSDKNKLISLLNSILNLSEGLRIKDLDYIPSEQMPLFLEGKRSIFDLKVKDESGNWYIVEMQRKSESDYTNRAQLYGSYTYVNQINIGTKHKDLLPVIVISIIGNKIFPDNLPCINYHSLKETSTNKQYLFSVAYVFVELGKFDKNKTITNDVDQWLHLLKCASQENSPPAEINNDDVLSAYTDLEQYRWSANEHDAYIRAKIAMEAEEDRMEESEKKGVLRGLKIGEKIGEERGLKEGERVKAVEIAKNLLSMNLDVDVIVKATGLTRDEIESITKT
jgi:predicted transposase/invertase (TIGR01784 family)